MNRKVALVVAGSLYFYYTMLRTIFTSPDLAHQVSTPTSLTPLKHSSTLWDTPISNDITGGALYELADQIDPLYQTL